MKALLDTHAFLWFVWGDSRMSAAARAFMNRPDATIYISVASLWEIAIKNSLNKLALNEPIADFFTNQADGNGFIVLPIERAHLLTVHTLPLHHRDPFNRLIAAQSLTEAMPLSTPIMSRGCGKLAA